MNVKQTLYHYIMRTQATNDFDQNLLSKKPKSIIIYW